jgi:hypothetical protein
MKRDFKNFFFRKPDPVPALKSAVSQKSGGEEKKPQLFDPSESCVIEGLENPALDSLMNRVE